MCFYITNYKAKIAQENIVCYKTLYKRKVPGGYKSAIQSYFYKVGKNNPEVKFRMFGSTIEEGYHSFSKKPKFNIGSKHIVECIIPKGATYYYNGIKKEYCSNRIRLVKRIK